MTIDAAEIARLREEWQAFPPVTALLDELEKARDLNDKAHSALGVTRQQRDLLENELDVLSASHKDLASRVAEMGKALKDIAQQKLIEEYAAEADPNTGDWEGAYDACVRRARAALAPKP